jgi:hypothetical protein
MLDKMLKKQKKCLSRGPGNSLQKQNTKITNNLSCLAVLWIGLIGLCWLLCDVNLYELKAQSSRAVPSWQKNAHCFCRLLYLLTACNQTWRTHAFCNYGKYKPPWTSSYLLTVCQNKKKKASQVEFQIGYSGVKLCKKGVLTLNKLP